MTFWVIIWTITFFITGCLVLLEYVNGSNNLRFWISLCLVFFLIISAIFVIGSYKSSKDFYNDYLNFYKKVQEAELSESQEYSILGKVIIYTNKLYSYKEELHHWGFFAPIYHPIKNLSYIELKAYNTLDYIW